MSVATTLNYPQELPTEPFGQAGVRQYAGRLLAWVFITIALSAFAMGHRSNRYSDAVDWRGQGQMLKVISGSGQLLIEGGGSEQIKGEGGWSYRGGYGGRRLSRMLWESSIGQTIGFEARMEPPSRDLDKGFWVRLNWSTLGALAMIQPTVFVLRRLVDRLRRAAPEAT